MQKYRLIIERVDNGFTIRVDNDNHISKVYRTLGEIIDFIKEFWNLSKRV